MVERAKARSERPPDAAAQRPEELRCFVCGYTVHLTRGPRQDIIDGWFIRAFDQICVVHIACYEQFWDEFDLEDLPHVTMTAPRIR